ncbi:MAG: hypothetical protein QOF63_232 [Thermoanaerobaculia bacterium]|jgi:hypothetical protein|nr:hypothetical protein [Thermoanaerobaculia bacterium]
MSNTVNNTPGTSKPDSVSLTPEAVIEQIRTLRSQIDAVTPLSKAQRNQLKQRTRSQPAPIVDASIGVIGSSATVAQAVGQPLVDVLQLQTESVRWGHVADELRSFLKGVEGANLVRRERLAFIAAQAYSFGSQLARNPDNADLVPQVEEIKRLKSFVRRKKAAQVPQPPSPAPTPSPGPVTSTAPKA